MEAFSTVRFFRRRTVICFLFIFMTFIACAFYTFFYDSKNNSSSLTPFKLLDINDLEEEDRPHTLEALVFHNSKLNARELRNTSPLPPAALQRLIPVVNISSRSERKMSNSVQAKTKYLYIDKAIPPSVTSSASVYKATTSKRPLTTDTCNLMAEGSKLILLWTPFYDHWDYFHRSSLDQCTRCRNCKVTTDKSKLSESDAVIFHARDMSILDLPPVRLPHQRWIFYCLESPPYSDFPGLMYTRNMFNWTMTYRADSDIFSPYGYVTKVHPPRKLDMQNLQWAWSNKSRSIVWMSSHCPTDGGRDLFAEELRKYIDVDVYGSCGSYVCPKGQTEKCLLDFDQKYKFFLAFENTLCKDYISEKFFRTLKYNIIPVVFGGADYDKFAPPGSFIDALRFKSPKHLAFFLAGVGKDFRLYSSYFKWRRDYAVNFGNKKECQLCSMLHNKTIKPSSYENLRDWWVKGSKCKSWKLHR